MAFHRCWKIVFSSFCLYYSYLYGKCGPTIKKLLVCCAPTDPSKLALPKNFYGHFGKKKKTKKKKQKKKKKKKKN